MKLLNSKVTCREEILAAVHVILSKKAAAKTFTIKEVIAYMKNNDTSFAEATIRTHISSRCTVNTPNHHETVYNDFVKVNRGTYALYLRGTEVKMNAVLEEN